MPPVGQNQVLSTAQIRYCLAEDIRMESAKSTVNNYIESLRDFWIAQADLDMALIGKPSIAGPAGPATTAEPGAAAH